MAIWAITAALVKIELTAAIRRAAATLAPASVRSLDAIHLATAASVAAELTAVLTYDVRMQNAAQGLGLAVIAPD